MVHTRYIPPLGIYMVYAWYIPSKYLVKVRNVGQFKIQRHVVAGCGEQQTGTQGTQRHTVTVTVTGAAAHHPSQPEMTLSLTVSAQWQRLRVA